MQLLHSDRPCSSRQCNNVPYPIHPSGYSAVAVQPQVTVEKLATYGIPAPTPSRLLLPP